MKQLTKIIMGIVMGSCSTLCTNAQTTLKVNKTNGTADSYLFTESPVITWSGDNGILLTSSTTSKQYKISELSTLTLEDAVKVTSISLDNASCSLNCGDTKTLVATVLPSNATCKTVVWSSSNTNVARVDNGVITAVAAGSAVIKATAADGSGVTASCTVTVTQTSTSTDPADYDNTVYIQGTEALVGSEVTLSMQMKNNVSITGFQCDVFAPNKTSIEKDEDDMYLIELSETRTTAKKTNYFDSALQSDGSVRIMCSSTKNYTFSGSEGEVATIKLKIGDDIADGEYPLTLKNIVLSDADGKTYKADCIKTTLSVYSCAPGDANGDNEVNVGDFTTIANYIMGTNPSPFVAKAADTNNDGEINVGDLTGVANIVLHGTSSAKAKAPAKAADISGYDNVVYASDATVGTDRTAEVSVNMKNSVAMTGFQFDVVLPNGISVAKDKDDFYLVALSTARTTAKKTNYFDSALQSDGSLRVMCSSTKSYTFSGNDGEVCTMTLKAEDTVKSGTYDVTLKNIVMSDANGKSYKIDKMVSSLVINTSTGISNIDANTDAEEIYSTNGIRMSSLQKGINIVKTKNGATHKIIIR